MRSIAVLLPMLSLLLGCATAIQAELDSEVERRCAIDGGVKVFETAERSAGNPDIHGGAQIPSRASSMPHDKYYFESETNYIRKGNPEVRRTEYRIVRALDKKVMGISVVYMRRGGDLPSPMHETSFVCPATGSQPNLEKSIFLGGR